MNNENCQSFENYFSNFSYVNGFRLSSLNYNICRNFEKYNLNIYKYPNINRWFKHLMYI